MDQINLKKQIRFLVTPDKFRGSLNASQVCEIVEQSLKICQNNYSSNIGLTIQKSQLADGGQGTLQVLYKNQVGLQKIQIISKDPLFRPIKTYYLIDQQNKIAYVQMAQTSGLSLLQAQQKNPLKTSTIGVGEIINDILLNKKCQKIYLFIGGSATNDAGIGMASALGYKFIDKNGVQLLPIGQNLLAIDKIIQPQKQIRQKITINEIFVVTDVQNVFYGENGAAKVYGPQKGANSQDVQILDQGLMNINEVFERQFQKDLKGVKGSGAAGGLGGGAIIFLKAKIQKGIQKMMQIVRYQQKIQRSHIVITGQGKLDRQSLQGKVVYGVLRRVKQHKKRLWIICGINELDIQKDLKSLYENIQVIQLWDSTMTKQQSMQNAKILMKRKIIELFNKLYQQELI